MLTWDYRHPSRGNLTENWARYVGKKYDEFLKIFMHLPADNELLWPDNIKTSLLFLFVQPINMTSLKDFDRLRPDQNGKPFADEFAFYLILIKLHWIVFLDCCQHTASPYHNELNNNNKIRLTNPQLMEMPSFCLSPVAPVLFRRSDPARSTKWNLAVNVSNSLVGPFSELSNVSTMFSTLSSPSTWEERNCGIYQRLYST